VTHVVFLFRDVAGIQIGEEAVCVQLVHLFEVGDPSLVQKILLLSQSQSLGLLTAMLPSSEAQRTRRVAILPAF
jgi:hypothetical protein